MSGIVGILHLDGAPLDRSLLEQLTDFQSFRGPDARGVWFGGCVGFGHTLLKTTEEAEHESQPFTLDGNVWIVADARVDAQHELRAALADKGQSPAADVPDVELILRAYLAWGEDCIEHLLGDFAFAIWNGPRRRLFCARDHMGVKPFYYAYVGSVVVFSNTLDCIRQHPAVSRKLNDLAITDFLLFETNQDPATTSFADIQRLPPAHTAAWSESGLNLRRYWTLPIDEPLFLKRADNYCDRFRELLGVVVGDRLRTHRVGVFMSGGLDSTTLAAVTQARLRESGASYNLAAFLLKDDLEPTEQEALYGNLVAKHLGIPLHIRSLDGHYVDPDWERIPFHTPEPVAMPWNFHSWLGWMRSISAQTRVVFHGEGADNALFWEWRPYVSYLLRRRHYGHFMRAAWATLISNRKPPYWTRLMRKFWQWRAQGELDPHVFPCWLNPHLEATLQLRQRWEARYAIPGCPVIHPFHPQAYASLHLPLWQTLFEGMDSEWTRTLMETRHPMADIRCLRFLLSVPPLPWCREKYLERRAMRGALPKPVLRRTKFNVARPIASITVFRGDHAFASAPELSRYVNPEGLLVPSPAGPGTPVWMRARALNHWLQNSMGLEQNTLLGGSSR